MRRVWNPATSPPCSVCFDIFSPLPGDKDVISHFERLNSIETKIAPRSVRMALGSSDWSAIGMVVSRVVGEQLHSVKERGAIHPTMGSDDGHGKELRVVALFDGGPAEPALEDAVHAYRAGWFEGGRIFFAVVSGGRCGGARPSESLIRSGDLGSRPA